MLLSLFIVLPLVVGLILLLMKNQKPMKWLGAFVGGVLLAAMTYLYYRGGSKEMSFAVEWFNFNHLKTYFALNATGLGGLMVFLSNLVYVLLFGYLASTKQKFNNSFYGLLLITLAGLNGVFLAQDLILFYFFWEIVLIPIYFLIGIWGKGNDKIKANMTFFLYTIFGSMFMLAGIIFIGFNLKPTSFLLEDVQAVTASRYCATSLLALLFLFAFVIKIPIFPFHTWQPTIYKTSATPVTVVLSALMAKMGLFAVVNWYIGLFSIQSEYLPYFLIPALIGILYASFIAISAIDVKKIIAYSSIAHLALIFISLFTNDATGYTGAFFQMFSHGLVVLGLWLIVDIMERRYDVRDIESMSGLATVNPVLAIFFIVFAMANIALPLTSSFIGEFMMLTALFKYNVAWAVIASLGVILSAVYMLRLAGALLFGEVKTRFVAVKHIESTGVIFVLSLIAILIIYFGVNSNSIFYLLAR
ncbi:complex I subunit 4 family protein [Vaginella massiliensis]|uniref:complex I subunit 4 family protein n=1 Tax=Vaginella massiliensis TaxID=1816680 RepID=UPI000837CD29|nr:NADH-quinone oxidoreductase subunit M [Vaginella massiliensis]